MNEVRHLSSSDESERIQVGQWLSSRIPLNWETWIYIAILLLALFTRFYMLGDRVMSHDESLHTKFSWDLYRNGVFQHTPLMHGPILFHVTALSYFLFGDNDFTARIYPAVLGVLMVMFPLLFRRWLGRWGSILASIMILISPLLMYYNRYIREDTPSIFYTLIMVYCTFMYLNGPTNLRRRARWLYILSAAMLASLATKEVAFMYIAIFGSFLTLYWLVRMLQHFRGLPGRTLMYLLSISVLVAGVASLAMYVVLSIAPLETVASLGVGSLEFSSLIRWTIAVVVAVLVVVAATALWVFRGRWGTLPKREVMIILWLALIFSTLFIYVEERSHVLSQDASRTADPSLPGEAAGQLVSSGYEAWPFYLFWVVCLVVIGLLIYAKRAGWWRKLHRFPELDILVVMGTLVLPWATPLVMKLMKASVMSMPSIAASVQAAIPFIQFDLTQYGAQIFLSALPVLPAMAVAVVAGYTWNWRRWLIAAAIFHVLFLFFFTTVFTNIQGVGTGMIGSLGYWLEQQAVRRGNQPQYYYLTIILPFYEFLPIVGSVLTMFGGFGFFWRYRLSRLDAATDSAVKLEGEPLSIALQTESSTSIETAFSPGAVSRQKVTPGHVEWISSVPFLLFVSWWAVFNLIAYTLAGEKMPWLGTHMTMPMIFLAAHYFGRVIGNVDRQVFYSTGWKYLLILPVLAVGFAQIAAPFVFWSGVGGLEQEQLTRTFQWFGGIVVSAAAMYVLWRIQRKSGWRHLRAMIGVSVFVVLGFLTFRSAWMASFINYDYPTEYLVYAHGAPANKEVTEQLDEWSRRITAGNELKFAYDFKISWPGAWYFRNFKNAVYLGETPNPRSLDGAEIVIVGDENRASVETMLEDRYFRFDYPRLWWPMQDYFNLTPDRIINTFDFSPSNTQAAQIRHGLWDIWWNRDYASYGQALGRDFSLPRWPVADRMYVFVRKDMANQIWDLSSGQGAAANLLPQSEVNLCNANWQQLSADQVLVTGPDIAPMNRPRQVALGPDGRILVAEEFNNRISVFNPDGSFAFAFGREGTGPGQFQRPNGVAVGPSGNIYVADTWNYRIQVFNRAGEYLTGWGQRGEYGAAAPAQPFDAFWGPRAVIVDANERVYVADTGNKRIRVYNGNGAYVLDIGSGGSGNGQLEEPSGLAINPAGQLLVADTWNRRVSVFNFDGSPYLGYVTTDGQPANHFRVRGWIDDLGNRPYLAFDPSRGLIYVTDPDAGRVLVFDSSGSCVGSFGQLSRENPDLTQFSSIGGIATDSQGNVYVADAGSGRVMRFAPFERPPQPVGADLASPVSGAELTEELVFPADNQALPLTTAEVTDPVSG